MPTKITRSTLSCVHPALSTEFTDESDIGAFTGKYEFSLQMALFLHKFLMGASDLDKACGAIALRRAAYDPPLLSEFGVLTDEGREAAAEARILISRIRRFNNGALPTVGTAKRMDEIIPFGQLNAQAIRMLRYMWQTYGTKPPEFPEPIEFTRSTDNPLRVVEVVYDGIRMILLSSIRNSMTTRTAVEILIKYGLVDFYRLPKLAKNRGKGRPPVAFSLSESGNRFFLDFLATYDAPTKFWQEHKADIPPIVDPDAEYDLQARAARTLTMPDFPAHPQRKLRLPLPDDPTDEVDGENLKDLFG